MMSGPDPQDPNSPLYTIVDTQPTSPPPNTPDSSLSHFTVRQFVPTGITAANPIVVTASSHGLSNGDTIRAMQFITRPVANATGMEQLNERLFYVQQVTEDTFILTDKYGRYIDGSNYTAYVSGGMFVLTGNPILTVNPSAFPP